MGQEFQNSLDPSLCWDSPQIVLQTDVTNRLILFHRSWNVATSGVGCCEKKNTTVTGVFVTFYFEGEVRGSFDPPWFLEKSFFFFSFPPSTAGILLLGTSDVTCWEVMRVSDCQLYQRTKTIWLCMGCKAAPLSLKIRLSQWLFPLWTGSVAGMFTNGERPKNVLFCFWFLYPSLQNVSYLESTLFQIRFKLMWEGGGWRGYFHIAFRKITCSVKGSKLYPPKSNLSFWIVSQIN